MDRIKVEDLPSGWFTNEDIETYRKLYSEIPNKGKTVEVGVWKGRSLISVLDIIVNNSLTTWGVDNFSQEAFHPAQVEEINTLRNDLFSNLEKFNFDKEHFINLPSIKAAKLFEDKSLDFVFIDGSHTYEAVTEDLAAWFPKIKQGGVMTGHDFDFPPVARAVNEFCLKNNFKVESASRIIWKIKIV